MHIRPQFEETRNEVLHDLIRAYPLGTLVTAVDAVITIEHMPFLLASDNGEHGMLCGHMPRSNPICSAFDGDREAIAVFQGPNAYITPSWYPSKHEHGRAVPTWNYAVVHVRGRPRVIDDGAWLLRHLTDLTDEHEARQALPWKVSDAPADYTEKMIEKLVGIEIPIDSIVGKWKLSQNRPVSDRLGVAAGLRSRGDQASIAMEDLVLQHAESRRDLT